MNGHEPEVLRRSSLSSALGLANEPASMLAERLVMAANPPFNCDSVRTKPGPRALAQRFSPKVEKEPTVLQPKLGKVFFSDDGSTSLEVALKLAYEHTRRSGRSPKP